MIGDCWTVYGRVKRGLSAVGSVEFRGLHLDRAPSLEMANSFVQEAIDEYGEGAVDCVIVHLVTGTDAPGTRRVVRRVSNGRAWWE